MYAVFGEMKPRLHKLQAKPRFVFDTNTVLKTLSFSLRIETKDVRNFHLSLNGGILTIVCPDVEDITEERVQNTIRNAVEHAMRYEAKRLFPAKLDSLAKQFNFTYGGISINKSRSRWGSCSSRKSINLSYYCLLLPEYLIDFVMLHELCHTIEMNHGVRFWSLLDKVTGGKAKEYTAELKKYSFLW